MDWSPDRRQWIQAATVATAAIPILASKAEASLTRRHVDPGQGVKGKMTGARATVEVLHSEGCECVYGIPGAQENELWDAFKTFGLPYLLCTHEYSASAMADGYARALGKPGVIAVVPGPGVTNALTGIGEALLDSVPMVCLVGDVARGEKFKPFQVHCLDTAELLKPVTKAVIQTQHVSQIAEAIRDAFALAVCGEPGPVAVVVPYTQLTEAAHFDSPARPPAAVPFDPQAAGCALAALSDPRIRVGVYAGQGCMAASAQLTRVAELLQAPVATSVSGKGVIDERHPLSVGWGYGPHASAVAEDIFHLKPILPHKTGVDCVLAVGVKYSEVSTGFYSDPPAKLQIHVDAESKNIGRVLKADIPVHADAGAFLDYLEGHGQRLRRPTNAALQKKIVRCKAERQKELRPCDRPLGADPLGLILAVRSQLACDGLAFVDVSLSEHLAAEAFQTRGPRTYFNPVDNQSMGWSIPAALGAQKVLPGRQVVTITGDGCMMMSAMEISTAAREHLPVKFFILDDRAYHYMQVLQKAAYLRTTATALARIDYQAFAQAMGVAYLEVGCNGHLEQGVASALAYPGPVLVRVRTDYGDQKVRWIDAVRKRYTDELSGAQKARFVARAGVRVVHRNRGDD